MKVQVRRLGGQLKSEGRAGGCCSWWWVDHVGTLHWIMWACRSVSCPCAAPHAPARPPDPSGGMHAQMAHLTPRPMLHSCPMQVPLMWTVYLQLAFRHFVLLGPDAEARQPGFFEVRGSTWGCCRGSPCATAWHGRRGAAMSPAHTKHCVAKRLFSMPCPLRDNTTPALPCCGRNPAGLLVAGVTGLAHARSTLSCLALMPCLPWRSPCLAAAAAWLHAGPNGGGRHRGQEGGAAAGAV